MATLNQWLQRTTRRLVLGVSSSAAQPPSSTRAHHLRKAGATLLMLGAATASHAFELQFKSLTDVDPVPTRGVLEYTAQIENSGFSTANDVRTVFAIPAGATVEGGALALPTAANANCAVSGAFVVCSHGTMVGTGAGGGTPAITFTLKFRAPLTLPGPPNVVLRAAIGVGAPPLGSAQAAPAAVFGAGSSFWAGDTNEANNVQDQQTTLEDNADLSVSKVSNLNPVFTGYPTTYTVTVTNNGTGSNTTTGIRVRDTLPAGVTYIAGSASGAGWSFGGPTAGVLTATRGTATLAPGASVSFSFSVTVNTASGTITNNVEVDTDRGVAGALLDNNPANNTFALVTPVTPATDLAASKGLRGVSPPFAAGTTLPFRLEIRNLSVVAATGVVVRDVLPTGHTLPATFPLPPSTVALGSFTCRTNAAGLNDSDVADVGRLARTILRCTLATAPAGFVENIDFDVNTDAGLSGLYTNVGSVSSTTADAVPGNNASGASYTLLPDGADVELISFAKSPIVVASAGGAISNTVRVRNNGPRAVAGNLQVFITLGASETLVSTGPGWSCAAEAGGARCTFTGTYPIAALATSGGGGFPDLTFTTQANAVGTLTSNACVGGTGGSAEPTVTGFTAGTTTDFITSNDCSGGQGVTATDQRADLVLTKATSTPTGGDKVVSISEDSVTYTLVVSNAGPNLTSGVVVEDLVPGFIAGQTVVSICGFVGAGSCLVPATNNFPINIGNFTCSLSNATVSCRTNGATLGLGAGNATTFVVRVGRGLRDSLTQVAVPGCSTAGQFCNSAGVGIDGTQVGAAIDPTTGNNNASDFAEVHAVSNIQTTAKTFIPATARVGVDLTYTINYRNPAAAGSDLPAVPSPAVGQPAGVVFIDTFTLPANNTGFVLRSATIASGAACAVVATTGGVLTAPGAGGTSYRTTGGAAGTVVIECPAVTLARNQDRQMLVVVRPNPGAAGPLDNSATFRVVDSTSATVSASGSNYNYNSDTTAADDLRTASAPFDPALVDLRVENDDLVDPIAYDPAQVATSPGDNDIVYRVRVRNAGPSVATGTSFDYLVTPPTGATVRFVGDEGGTAVTMTSGATTPARCVVFAGANPAVAPATMTLRCTTPGFGLAPETDGVIVPGTAATDGAVLNLRMRFESVPAPGGATVATVATATANEPEFDGTNNNSGESTTVRSRADLGISKTAITAAVPALPAALPASVASVGLNQPFTWVVDVVNNGPGDSLSRTRTGTSPLNGTGTSVTDTLPAGVTVTGPITWEKTGTTSFVGAVPVGSGTCVLAAPTITCDVGDVAANGRVRISVPARWATWPGTTGNVSGPQTNSAAVASEQFDPVGSNNNTSYDITVTRSSLAGVVFEDTSRVSANAGTVQSGEPLLGNVTVVLRATTGLDAYGLAFTPRSLTTTVGTGAYLFDNLPAGSFEIVEAQPAGYTNSSGDPTAAASGTSPSLGGTYTATGATPAPAPAPAGANSRYSGITLAAQQDGVRYNFPEVGGVSLAGVVYIDFNLNNVYDLGVDVPINNAPVVLRNAANLGVVLASTNTGPDGSYSFNNLDSSFTYVVEQPLPTTPAGLTNRSTAVNPGTVLGTVVGTAAANSPVADTDRITGISLAAGNGVAYNFGETLLSFISGTVYIDRNRDGTLTAADPGRIGGVTIRLVAGPLCTGTELGTTTTDSSGNYLFSSANLVAPASISPTATYSLCQLQPAAYGNGSTNPGTAGTSPAANHIVVTNPPVSGAANQNFGEQAGLIAGRVYLDAANDGLFNGPDVGLPTVTVTLTGGSLPPAGINANTLPDGTYRFDDLPAGSYVLTEQTAQPTTLVAGATVATLNGITGTGSLGGTATTVATATSAISAITLPAGGQSLDNLFGEILPAQISGSVYSDLNNDGVRQAGEPGYGVHGLQLVGSNDLGPVAPITVQTDGTGNYIFPNLRPGTYTVTEPTQPAGSTNGITTPGIGGGTATPVATVPSAISGIVLTAGLSATGQNFGEIGNTPNLVVTKSLAPATFTEQNRGTYTLAVANVGQVASSGTVTVTDTLPAGFTAIAGTATAPNPRGTGWSCTVASQVVTCTSTDAIAAGATSASSITLDVQVGSNLCAAGSYPCSLSNVVAVSGGGEPAALQPTPAELANPPVCTALPTQNVCRLPTPVQQSGGVSGLVWLDANHDRVFNTGDTRLPGFVVELLQNGSVLRTAVSDGQGQYQITGLVPGNNYELRFKDPVTGAYYGRPVSTDPAGGNDPSASGAVGVVATGSIRGFTVPGGNAIRTNQNLPLDPSGVVYDSQTRQPVAGALVEFLGPNGALVPAQCALGGVNRVTTATSGAGVVPGGYAFWLIAPAPAGCPGDGTYSLRVTPPAGYINAGVASTGSLTATSNLIPAQVGAVRIPASCQAYLPGAPCVVQTQPSAPTGSQPTPYFFSVPLTPNTPATFVDVVNNHIPLDPFGNSRFVISKQASRSTADIGDAVTYSITVKHLEGPALPNVRVDDLLPAGFRYVPGTTRQGGVLQLDPAGKPGPKLGFALGTLPINGQITFTYITRVGVGAQQGDGINTAQAFSSSGALSVASNIAKARVRVTGGVFTADACVVGKVYVDCNNNQVQNREELGIPGVRLFMEDGTTITTDVEGKYSYCGLAPRTHVLKADPLSLPRGSRLVTSSNRNAGDAHSIFVDAKNGELHRADFIEGSCSNTVLEQVKARRSQGEVRAVETEKKKGPALKFEGKAAAYPQQGTDSANQPNVKTRENAPKPTAPVSPSEPEQNTPVPQLPAASNNTQRSGSGPTAPRQ